MTMPKGGGVPVRRPKFTMTPEERKYKKMMEARVGPQRAGAGWQAASAEARKPYEYKTETQQLQERIADYNARQMMARGPTVTATQGTFETALPSGGAGAGWGAGVPAVGAGAGVPGVGAGAGVGAGWGTEAMEFAPMESVPGFPSPEYHGIGTEGLDEWEQMEFERQAAQISGEMGRRGMLSSSMYGGHLLQASMQAKQLRLQLEQTEGARRTQWEKDLALAEWATMEREAGRRQQQQQFGYAAGRQAYEFEALGQERAYERQLGQEQFGAAQREATYARQTQQQQQQELQRQAAVQFYGQAEAQDFWDYMKAMMESQSVSPSVQQQQAPNMVLGGIPQEIWIQQWQQDQQAQLAQRQQAENWWDAQVGGPGGGWDLAG